MKRIVLAGTMLPLLFAGALSAADTINAAGATFPAPIYQKWFEEFKAKTGNQINYQSVGSSAGVKQLTEGTVDFGASDGPMTDEQLKQGSVPILHFPTVLGADIPILLHIAAGLTHEPDGSTLDRLRFAGANKDGVGRGHERTTVAFLDEPRQGRHGHGL